MRKEDKLNLLHQSKINKEIVTCYFSFDNNYVHYYVLDFSDKFVLAQEEFDFRVKDGYELRKISRLKKNNIRYGIINDIAKTMGIENNLKEVIIDMSSWYSIFSEIKNWNKIIRIDVDNGNDFFYGKIIEVRKNRIMFNYFNNDGVYYDEPFEVNFRDIDGIEWDTEYIQGWNYYFSNMQK